MTNDKNQKYTIVAIDKSHTDKPIAVWTYETKELYDLYYESIASNNAWEIVAAGKLDRVIHNKDN